MNKSNNQEKEEKKLTEYEEEIDILQKEVVALHLKRDILALSLEIRELGEALYGNTSTEETSG